MKTKEMILAAALLAAGLQSGAQTLDNAIMFSDDNAAGTARSMALGGAMTAVGSDMGSIQINPAGSAVASYTQCVISPGLTVATSSAAFAAATPQSENLNFGDPTSYAKVRFRMPSAGALLYYDTHKGYGLKSMSFALMLSQSSCYDAGWKATGVSGHTSVSGLLASNATGRMDPKILSYGDNKWNYNDWAALTAYYGGLISYLPEKDWYFGAAETVETDGTNYSTPYVKGLLKNSVFSQTAGVKSDILLNLGANIEDKIYIGVNLCFPTGSYTNTYEVHEVPVDVNDFQNQPAYYSSKGEWVKADGMRKLSGLSYVDTETMSVTGVYGKIGVIYLPNDFLRLGAAVRTPALYTIVQNYRTDVRTEYLKTNTAGTDVVDDFFSGKAGSPTDGRTSFKFNSAWGFNVGAAATIGQRAMVSLDYELNDFTHMEYRYSNKRVTFNDPFEAVNTRIKDNCGVSHNVRVGAEFNVTTYLPVRVGYTFRSNPIKTELEGYAARNTFSCGLGYISAGSFFADLAARYTINPTSSIPVYGDYASDKNGVKYFSPTVQLIRNGLWDVVLTLGWRF